MMAIRELSRAVASLLLTKRSVYGGGQCHRGLASWSRDGPKAAARAPTGKQRATEKLWREFFSDPSQWWDHRLEKENSRFPDFKHKLTQEGLWLDGKSNPSWVEAELTALAPETTQLSLFSWNKRLARYVDGGEYQKTVDLFRKMLQEGLIPNKFTCVPVLKACSSLGALQEGKHIHKLIREGDCESDVFVDSCLVDMYAKCGSIEDAWTVFNKMPERSVISWSAMILGCVKCGQGLKALELFQQMQQEGVEPDPVIYVGVLNACASVAALEEGYRVHEEIVQRGYEANDYVGNCLVDMYVKCGSIEDAEKVFYKMPTRSVIARSAMILGYVKCGEAQKALGVYRQMYRKRMKPDPPIFVGVLKACASVGDLEEGRRVHERIIQSGCESDVFVTSSLVDMYAKCGSIEDAQTVFDKLSTRNVVSWNTMLGGYAMHGLGNKALQFFNRMYQEGVEMDGITFVSLLTACCNAGLVDEGIHFLESMTAVYGISPIRKHYSCVVDLLGRAGRLHGVEELMGMMSCEPDANLWMSLVIACRVHGNVEMGERAGKRVMELDSQNSGGFVLPSDIYVATGMQDSSTILNQPRIERGVMKKLGCTWISVNNEVHSFDIEDRKHPHIGEVLEELSILIEQMEEAGYVSDARFEMQDLDVDRRQVRLCSHSEKLAIAFGLISTPPGTPLRIFKNLRGCADCHDATKFISKMVGRAITVRDTNRFHHFQDGNCSCKD